MSLETDLQEAIRQHAASRELWQQQSTMHEQTRVRLEQSVGDYLQSARSEYPILRLSANQILNGTSGAPPSGWAAHPNCSFEKVCTVFGAEQARLQSITRHPESVLLLETIKDPHRDFHIGRPFNIWRMSWMANTPYTMYQYVPMGNALTGAFALSKLESGVLQGHWAAGCGNEWKLTGQFYGGGCAGQYTICHPIPDTNAGSILIALPAVVIGKKSVDDKIWGLFPFLGSEQYD